MKFFKPEDFAGSGYDPEFFPEYATNVANAKLEREGRVVYSKRHGNIWELGQHEDDTVKALLINIEPIEKCTHPRDKVIQEDLYSGALTNRFKCECGAKVKPKSFEVVE
jgi:hypothetical protein